MSERRIWRVEQNIAGVDRPPHWFYLGRYGATTPEGAIRLMRREYAKGLMRLAEEIRATPTGEAP